MTESTRGIYPHFNTPGERPTDAELRTYGLAINLADQVMWTLNELGSPVPLPLSLESDIGRYEGYGVPLVGSIPKEVPDHVRSGKVRNIAEVIMHIYYSRPQLANGVGDGRGDFIRPLVMQMTKRNDIITIRRIKKDGVNVLEVATGAGDIEFFTAPEEAFTENTNLYISAREYRTRITAIYTRARGTLTGLNALSSELPDHINDRDPALDTVMRVVTSGQQVRAMAFNLLLVDATSGLPLLLQSGAPHRVIELAIFNPPV